MWDGGGERAARGVGGGLAWAGHGRRATCGRNLPGTWLFYAVRAARFVGRSVSLSVKRADTFAKCVSDSVTYDRKPTRRTARVLSKVHDAPSRKGSHALRALSTDRPHGHASYKRTQPS